MYFVYTIWIVISFNVAL